ncbi:sugar transferase [Collinsella stercoris]|uniref:sugar transferase n=1 Tax=Collinsella stercoris TaxID=147206 RepID=UPI003AF0B5F5
MSLNDEVKTNNREPDVIKTPVAGSRAAAAEESARPRGRMYPMEKVRAWDGSRLWYHFVKRLFDIVFSFAVIALAFVPGVILAILIRLETPGNPFYGQLRVGKVDSEGNPTYFKMWKFRSMVKDADQMKADLMEQNEVEGPMFKMEDDPRVTKIGKFIRKHSIDEFPQFLNVLLGDMSVVGPRPPLPDEVDQYDEWAMQRLAVKPGLTGPWQVGGRSNLDFEDMVRLDLGYIVKRSLKTDFILILQTIAVVFTGEGAK